MLPAVAHVTNGEDLGLAQLGRAEAGVAQVARSVLGVLELRHL